MKKLLVIICSLLFSAAITGQVRIAKVFTQNSINPLGLDNRSPAFSWQLESGKRNTRQSFYELRVAASPGDLRQTKKLLWSSGKQASDQSVFVPYKGPALQSTKKYFWQVRVWDQDGRVSPWSDPAFWQMGLLQVSDWQATWIEAGYKEDSTERPSPLFRKEFAAKKEVASAYAYITAHGMYEAYINGQRVGDAYLAPGWTSYATRLQYQVYDVTGLLEKNNALGVSLGSGWYRGNLVWEGKKDHYGNKPALLLQLEITYKDGTKDIIVTDETWKSATGAVRSSEIYHGEIIDAAREKKGWLKAGYRDNDWNGVHGKSFDKKILVATEGEPVRKHEIITPVKLITTPAGEKVLDFGQNLVGFVQLKVKGSKGDSVKVYHAEVLDKKGNFYTENLRLARQENIYILAGEGEEVFEPHFTFQGFRYIKLIGYPGEIKLENFTAVALYSDMKSTGHFQSSDSLLNQLQHNIVWGQKGNFLDVPTDCPQRDERLGWTGDAQVFFRTASFNMDVNNFFRKWMKDVAADQFPDGSVPFVVPNVLGKDAGGSAGWADAATIIPWNMYIAYGDKRILEQQYESMKRWVGFIISKSKNNLWNTGFHFGDWLFYRPDDDNDGRAALTDKYLIAQCFFAHSVQLLLNASNVLGKQQEVEFYTNLLRDVKAAFNKEYVTPSGRLVSSSQTAYVLALQFDMLPDNQRAAAAERLVQNIRDYGYHLTTGFLGTPYLCHVLTRFGYHDIAYTLLMQETYPSWLYPVKAGATTIWERWDGQKPDGSFQTPGMNSFNHYAYGAIGDWMYRVIAGIDTDSKFPGYKKIVIRPYVNGRSIQDTAQPKILKQVSASLETYYGTVGSEWKPEGDKLYMSVTIPVNTTATVYLPSTAQSAITESGVPVQQQQEIRVTGFENGWTKVEMGSGRYEFVIAYYK